MLEIERNKKVPRYISLVPLIDVGFFLLIFFMLAGSVQKFEIIPVELPVADSGRLIDEGPIEVVLGRHDEMLVNDDLIESDQLVSVIKQKLQEQPERVITLKVDSRLPATRMIAIMDLIKLAGGRNVSLVTQKL